MDRIQQTSEHGPGTGAGLRPREIVWVAIAQAGVPLASIASVKLLTRLLVPSDYGAVAIVTSCVLAALAVALVPMSGPGTILFHEWTKIGRTREFLGTLLSFYAVPACLIAVGLVFLASVRQLSASPLVNAAILYGALLVFTEVIKAPAIILINMARLRRRYALLSLLDGWGKLLLVLLMIILAGDTFQSVLVAYALNSAVVAFVGWYGLFNSNSGDESSARLPLFSAALLSSMLKSGWPFYVIGVANWVISVSDRALLGVLMSAHDVGIYSASCQVAAIFPMILYSFVGALVFPVIYQRYSWSPPEAAVLIGQSLGFLVWLIVPLTLGAILWKDVLLSLFVGRGYETGAPVILWVAPALALNTLISITAMPFWLGGRSSTYLVITAGAAACNVLLNLLLIPQMGFLAAAVSTFAAYLILFIASIVVGRRVINWKIAPTHLWGTGIGVAAASAAFIMSGEDASLVRVGVFAVAYFSSSIALLFLIDETSRVMVRSAFSRLTVWGRV